MLASRAPIAERKQRAYLLAHMPTMQAALVTQRQASLVGQPPRGGEDAARWRSSGSSLCSPSSLREGPSRTARVACRPAAVGDGEVSSALPSGSSQ